MSAKRVWVVEGRTKPSHKWKTSKRSFMVKQEADKYIEDAIQSHKVYASTHTGWPIPEYRLAKYVPAEAGA